MCYVIGLLKNQLIMKNLKKMTFFTTILILLIPLSFIAWINYVVTSNESIITHTKGFTTKKYPIEEMFDGTIHKELMHIAELANLCNLVYNREDSIKRPDKFSGWYRSTIVPIKTTPKDTSKKVLDDFYYEVWELAMSDNKKNIAIVFRGTQSAKDWMANARWFRRIVDWRTYDHYDQLNEISTDLISTIRHHPDNENKELTFIAAGHSLGGGLAQFLAYAVPEVKLVLAFNPSPVTGYYDLEKSVRVGNSKDVHVYRIYESGEALSYARDFMLLLYPLSLFSIQDPAIAQIRFSFSTGENLISQHGVEQMARKLTALKKSQTKCN